MVPIVGILITVPMQEHQMHHEHALHQKVEEILVKMHTKSALERLGGQVLSLFMHFYVLLRIRLIECTQFNVLLRIRLIECTHFYVLRCIRLLECMHFSF